MKEFDWNLLIAPSFSLIGVAIGSVLTHNLGARRAAVERRNKVFDQDLDFLINRIQSLSTTARALWDDEGKNISPSEKQSMKWELISGQTAINRIIQGIDHNSPSFATRCDTAVHEFREALTGGPFGALTAPDPERIKKIYEAEMELVTVIMAFRRGKQK